MRNDSITLGLRGIIIVQASRYKIQELIDTQGAVSTYQALDTLSNEPVLYYQYLAEPINNAVQILSDNIPDILNMHYISGMTHVITVFPAKKQRLTQRLEESQLEQFLLDTAQALEDASDAGVIHGDIRPERLLFNESKYLIEGYGIRWEFLPSRYSAPEKKQSVAGDVYSWAKTMGAFVPRSMPKTLAELLERCLAKDPKSRPLPEDIVDEIRSFYLAASQNPKHPTLINLKQTIADAQPDLLDNLFANAVPQGSTAILTDTQERFIDPLDASTPDIKSNSKQSPEKTSAEKIEASVIVEGIGEGSEESLKLSTADLASSNLQDVAELRSSRADISVNNTDSLPEVSSSARVTDASLTNQNISNENALMGSLVGTVANTQIQDAKNQNTKSQETENQETENTTTTELDTIDQGLAIIADAGTVATDAPEDDPFLIADDFSDLGTRVEIPDAEVLKTDIPMPQILDAEIPDLEIADIAPTEKRTIEVSDTEVILADNFATQERNIDFEDSDITGLDAIEHKATFHDLTSTQVDIVPLNTEQVKPHLKPHLKPQVLDDLDTEFNLVADIKNDVDETRLDDLLKDIPVKDIPANEAKISDQAATSSTDLESQAIHNFFPEIVKEDPNSGFSGDALDFSGDGFNQTSASLEPATETETSTETSVETETGVNKNAKDSQTVASSDGFDQTVFDATIFDETAFDAKKTAYGTEKTLDVDNISKQKNQSTEIKEEATQETESIDLQVLDLQASNLQASNLQASNLQDSDSLAPTSFPVNELDFGDFGDSQSLTDDSNTDDSNTDDSNTLESINTKNEEKTHLEAFQAVIAEAQPEQLLEPQVNANAQSEAEKAPDTVDTVIEDTTLDDINLSSDDLPNSTQLERAFAALSSPLEGEIATEFPAEIVADNYATQVPLELDKDLNTNIELSNEEIELLGPAQKITTDLKTEALNKAINEPTDEADSEVSNKVTNGFSNEFTSKSSEDILKSTSHLAEAEELFDNLPPSKETMDFSQLGINTDKPQTDLLLEESSEQEDLSLIQTNFSEVNTNIAVDDFPELVSENIADTENNSFETTEVKATELKAKEDMAENLLAFADEEVTGIPSPELDNDQSYNAFVDDMDDAAHAYTAQANEAQTSTIQNETTPELKATQEILNLIDEEEKELPKEYAAKQQGSDQDSIMPSNNPDLDNLTSVDLQDDLDNFLGDVLNNEQNSLLVTNSSSDSDVADGNAKATVFPIFSGQETLFTNETVQLEPNAALATQSVNGVNGTGIFADTQYDHDIDQGIDHNIDLSVDSAQIDTPNSIEIDDDDDLQVIELTEFETEEKPVKNLQASNNDVLDAKAARKARRAERRAAAEANEEIDVFKTAFGKIAKMQASVQTEFDTPNQGSSAELANGKTLTIDESKLTVFEAKHLSIAEKIVAKKNKTIADLENNKKTNYTKEPLRQTELGRHSRKVSQNPDAFGEDNYDAIGKLPDAHTSSKTIEAIEPKLTYFEIPATNDDLSEETQDANEATTKANKKKRNGFFNKKKNREEASSEAFETDANLNLNTDISEDLYNTSIAITTERQREFNSALAVNPIRNTWRIAAASLVLIGAGAIVFMALPDLLNAQGTRVEQSITRESQSLPGLTSDYPVYTQVIPANLDMITVEVIKSPENSKYPVGHQFNIFANSPLSLDVKGEWELQGKYQNRILSNTIPFELPKLGGEPLVFSFNF